MKRLVLISLGIMAMIMLAACAAVAEEDVAKLVPSEIAAPDFAKNLVTSLGDELKIDAQDITLVSAEKVQWRDSCLGVQRKGMMCMEVITPGYLIVFETAQGRYEAHTNQDGSAFIFVPQEATPTAVDSSTD